MRARAAPRTLREAGSTARRSRSVSSGSVACAGNAPAWSTYTSAPRMDDEGKNQNQPFDNAKCPG